MDTAKLKPQDVDVNLTFRGQATISVFDLETMIMPLLIDHTHKTKEHSSRVMTCSPASVKVTIQMTIMKKSILEMHGNLLDSDSVVMTTLSIYQ